MSFEIKPIEKTELPLLLSLIKELAEYENLTEMMTCTEEDYSRELFQKRSVYGLLLFYNGKAVGYVLYYFNFSSFLCKQGLFVEDIYIQPAMRGKGLGKAAFEYLEKAAKENNCGRMEWMCLDWNENSLWFYQNRVGGNVMEEWRLLRKNL